MKLLSKLGLAAAVVSAVVVGAFALVRWLPHPEMPMAMAYSEFMTKAENGLVHDVLIDQRQATGSLFDGKKFLTTLPDDASIIDRLLAHDVRVELVEQPASSLSWWMLLFFGLPFLLLAGGSMLSGGPAGVGRGAEAIGFGKSRAKLIAPNKTPVTLADVAGIDEAAEELKGIVEFLKDPTKFQRLGGKMPKGCLLIGPPGSGKTLLARAIAGEANVPFYTISGSDFVEMFVGVGAARVRDMFVQAKEHAPCIVFVDELDAVGRRRGTGFSQTNDEREQTLNQLLVEMDGFDGSAGIILLAATNRPDVLDPALLRPGRFDRQIVLTNPDVIGRKQILKVHLRKVPVSPDVDISVIARGTPGFSGADLANLVNEAALLAAKRGNRLVTMAEFEQSKDKVLMGAERRSMAMSEKEKRTTAYHEAGHALVTFYTPGSDPLHKVTIIPRGRTLGVTMSLPERDRYGFAKSELQAKIAVMFGGRVAEELIFGPENVTTGGADDIRQATELARKMVVEFGFSQKLGPLNYVTEELGALPVAFGEHAHGFSEATVKLVDEETRRLVEEGRMAAETVLRAHLADLHSVAKALLERETLTGADIQALLGDMPLVQANKAPISQLPAAPQERALAVAAVPAPI